MGNDIVINSSFLLPEQPRPICIIGAGGIVRSAHLPAYKKAGWEVLGIYDTDADKAAKLCADFFAGRVFHSIQEMIEAAPREVVYDVAVPASVLKNVLQQLPERALVLMQKPMGETIAEAKAIRQLCQDKQFIAAMNFQWRFMPAVLAAKHMIEAGLIGALHDMEIRMNIYHPWHLWQFLFDIPRMEILYHSIHYIDLLRYFFGDPLGVYAKTLKHPKMMQLASTRSIIILEYDNIIKAHINTNHGHEFGLRHQESFIKWEGTKGAIKTTVGTNINYPYGVEDSFEYSLLNNDKDPEWKKVQFKEKWFPDAFMGAMANLMCFAEGSVKVLVNSIDSAYKTMEVVEAAYRSSDGGGEKVRYD
jgi:predicted dehydrogenase